MKIAVLKERISGELRVAATPETVKKIAALGAEVYIEKGAGSASNFSDNEYSSVGAIIAQGAAEAVKGADIVLKVQPPSEKHDFKKGAIVISLLNPSDNKDGIEDLAIQGVSAFALELIPRISRAQSMDVLSSQSNLAGYKAVIDAVAEYGKAVPMMMTAAGTVKPAKVLILGAGVAGLQAIATAKRLGAVVSAFDVRPAAKEQVQSLGATFIEVKAEENAETSGGYAKEMSEEYKRRQSQLIHDTLKTQDIVITTALTPGKPAPVLITEAMVKDMKPGSVIADLAVERGGNCPLSERGKIVVKHGVKLIGYDNYPSRIANDASQLFARNVFNFLSLLIDKNKKEVFINMEDEIIKACLLTPQNHTIKSSASPSSAPQERRKSTPQKNPPRTMMEQKPHLKKKAKAARPVNKKD